MVSRIEEELALLRRHYERVDFIDRNQTLWFCVHGYQLFEPCSLQEISVVFSISVGFPGTDPYGFFVPGELTYDGQAYIGKTTPSPPPFPGKWQFFSWAPEQWDPSYDILTGDNLWGWVRSFSERLGEGP